MNQICLPGISVFLERNYQGMNVGYASPDSLI